MVCTEKKFQPKNLIDLATLTGAAIITVLVKKSWNVFNSTKLTTLLERVKKSVGEPVWNMPIDSSYEKDISSDIADMKNVDSERSWFKLQEQFL